MTWLATFVPSTARRSCKVSTIRLHEAMLGAGSITVSGNVTSQVNPPRSAVATGDQSIPAVIGPAARAS